MYKQIDLSFNQCGLIISFSSSCFKLQTILSLRESKVNMLPVLNHWQSGLSDGIICGCMLLFVLSHEFRKVNDTGAYSPYKHAAELILLRASLCGKTTFVMNRKLCKTSVETFWLILGFY